MKTVIASLAFVIAASAAMPFDVAQAQRSERVLTIYGNDKCPTSNGEEIVVCRRLDENERYRIPKDLRDSELTGNDAWNERARSFEYVGRSGAQSCSPVGSGGASGCMREMFRKARDERAANGEKTGVPF
ncbi:hypothetical protein [Sphingomonas fennica]|uniref:Uncharacterized protein n=1 Tax=Edaphosphingomonas fennica TaxID=114404 RepID=A0A2T4I7C0_9SPHN|nr:hypothetical protein [Sphingomonas fennica]PTD26727.1 hypothetical protein CV103_02815 [Sphingomonas fennica]